MFKFERVEAYRHVRKVFLNGEFVGFVRMSKAPYTYRNKKCAVYFVNSHGMGIKGSLKFCLEFAKPFPVINARANA